MTRRRPLEAEMSRRCGLQHTSAVFATNALRAEVLPPQFNMASRSRVYFSTLSKPAVPTFCCCQTFKNTLKATVDECHMPDSGRVHNLAAIISRVGRDGQKKY